MCRHVAGADHKTLQKFTFWLNIDVLQDLELDAAQFNPSPLDMTLFSIPSEIIVGQAEKVGYYYDFSALVSNYTLSLKHVKHILCCLCWC